MDARDSEGICGSWYESFDQERMQFSFYGEDDELIVVPAKWEVCGLCDGRGSHVNPSIDAHGLSPEDFAEDPGFAEDYFSGVYDETCRRCNGRTTEPTVDWDGCSKEQKKAAEEALQDHYSEIRERQSEIRFGY